ncbi:MAG: hypothetical protein IH940_00765 [Acidobacteria bacterium]|nr:hypothetical protein [Acidobacteriota bacterium]
MTSSDRSSPPTSVLATRRVRIGAWVLSGLAFVAGSIIGMTVSPQIGISLWFAAGVLAFLPFLAHRNNI